MNETTNLIEDNKYVELKYQVIDSKSGAVLTEVEFPLGYVHGVNEVLAPAVMAELEGKAQGDIIEVPIDCNKLYGPRDESLVISDSLDNVPEEYQAIGTAILMENLQGKTKSFLVTRIEGSMITFDANNPLCGREVIFKLNILLVRDATDDEIEAGGKVDPGPDVDEGLTVPIN
jgi:FKBP-type peptidyl-prolyl cis-trans isomerase SlyD